MSLTQAWVGICTQAFRTPCAQVPCVCLITSSCVCLITSSWVRLPIPGSTPELILLLDISPSYFLPKPQVIRFIIGRCHTHVDIRYSLNGNLCMGAWRDGGSAVKGPCCVSSTRVRWSTIYNPGFWESDMLIPSLTLTLHFCMCMCVSKCTKLKIKRDINRKSLLQAVQCVSSHSALSPFSRTRILPILRSAV